MHRRRQPAVAQVLVADEVLHQPGRVDRGDQRIEADQPLHRLAGERRAADGAGQRRRLDDRRGDQHQPRGAAVARHPHQGGQRVVPQRARDAVVAQRHPHRADPAVEVALLAQQHALAARRQRVADDHRVERVEGQRLTDRRVALLVEPAHRDHRQSRIGHRQPRPPRRGLSGSHAAPPAAGGAAVDGTTAGGRSSATDSAAAERSRRTSNLPTAAERTDIEPRRKRLSTTSHGRNPSRVLRLTAFQGPAAAWHGVGHPATRRPGRHRGASPPSQQRPSRGNTPHSATPAASGSPDSSWGSRRGDRLGLASCARGPTDASAGRQVSSPAGTQLGSTGAIGGSVTRAPR